MCSKDNISKHIKYRFFVISFIQNIKYIRVDTPKQYFACIHVKCTAHTVVCYIYCSCIKKYPYFISPFHSKYYFLYEHKIICMQHIFG